MPTLYRTYRPQTFNEVAGQEHIKLTLEYEIKDGRLAHAYLFCGPRAIGKTTMARLLAKAANCQKRKAGDADPCNTCQSCVDITNGSAMDVAEIDAASHTGVDNVRESVIASARLAPASSKYKIFIIDEAHMLSTAAFNALLKIMEEPPAHAIFILCTTEAHKVPSTIISRCQRFDFRKISYVEILKKLTRIAKTEKISLEPAVLEAIARHSAGHMRDAESLLGQVIALGGKANSAKGKQITLGEAELVIPRSHINEALELLDSLASRDAGAAVAFVNKLADDGVDLKIFANETVDLMRRLLVASVSPVLASALRAEFGETIEGRLTELSVRFDAPMLSGAIERFMQAGRDTKDAPIPQLPLELAIIDTCFGRADSSEAPVLSAPSAPRAAAPSARPAATPARPAAASSAPALAPSALASAWQELLVRVRQHNHSLSFVLKSCQPTGMDGTTLRLAFKYKFHHDRMNEPAIRQLVEGLLDEITGNRLVIATTLDPELILVENGKPEGESAPEPAEARLAGAAVEAADIDSSVIDNLLKTFGGKVVS